MKAFLIFIALWITDVRSIHVENRERMSLSEDTTSMTSDDSVGVPGIKEEEKVEKTSESATNPDHPVKVVKQDEAVVLDSIRHELDGVEKELEDMRTHFSESDEEDEKRDLSQSDPQGMLLFYILPDCCHQLVSSAH